MLGEQVDLMISEGFSKLNESVIPCSIKLLSRTESDTQGRAEVSQGISAGSSKGDITGQVIPAASLPATPQQTPTAFTPL